MKKLTENIKKERSTRMKIEIIQNANLKTSTGQRENLRVERDTNQRGDLMVRNIDLNVNHVEKKGMRIKVGSFHPLSC